MSHLVAESAFGKFSVRIHSQDDFTYMVVECNGLPLTKLEYATVSEAMPDYRMVSAMVRDVLACIRRDPTVVEEVPLSEDEEECDHAGHVPSPSTNDYEQCSKCGRVVDMRG